VRAPYTGLRPPERDGATQAAEAYVGYAVCDPRGRRIGRTTRVFVNGRGEPEYIGVKIGLFLPRKTSATLVARRPSTMPSASTTCHLRWLK